MAAEARTEQEAGSATAAWWARASRVLPGGVSSPVRAHQAVGGTPVVLERGEGPYVVDVDGRRWLDLVQSYGAVLLGHAHPAVTAALAAAAAKGTTFGATTPGEVRLAEAVCARVPGVEQVRLVSSGTEATMSALRLARAVTGRDRVVKFEGCYHGHADALLAGGGSGVATLGLPGSAGVPRAAVAETLVVPYNQVPDLDERVACVIVEPVAANMGLVPPAPGFLAGLREACDRAGALLVFDEVISGFRLGPGGATASSGVRPDLWCFGKVIGGGLPIGAFGGSRELMGTLAPSGPVYQAGTLSGNPLATAAGLAVLEAVQLADYEALSRRVAALAGELTEAFAAAGVAAQVPVVGPLLSVFFTEQPVRDVTGARAASAGRYRRFFHELARRGVLLPPSPFETWFPGMAHDDAVLGRVLEAVQAAAPAVAQEPTSD